MRYGKISVEGANAMGEEEINSQKKKALKAEEGLDKLIYGYKTRLTESLHKCVEVGKHRGR